MGRLVGMERGMEGWMVCDVWFWAWGYSKWGGSVQVVRIMDR